MQLWCGGAGGGIDSPPRHSAFAARPADLVTFREAPPPYPFRPFNFLGQAEEDPSTPSNLWVMTFPRVQRFTGGPSLLQDVLSGGESEEASPVDPSNYKTPRVLPAPGVAAPIHRQGSRDRSELDPGAGLEFFRPRSAR